MRIGMDASCWANGRGYGRFSRELARAMVSLAPSDEFVCFLDRHARAHFDLEAPNVRRVTVSQGRSPTLAATANGYRSPADILRFTRAVWRQELDVFFSPSVYTYFPLPPGLASVVTVHDTIAERFPELTLPSVRARLFWRGKVALALRQARLVLTVSKFAAAEIQDVLGVDPARIRVVGEAPAPVYRPSERAEQIRDAARRAGLPEDARWFVYVGGFNPHKQVDTLVRAHARLVRETDGPPPYLVLVGSIDADVFHSNLPQIRETIASRGTEEWVRWTGFLPDDELRHLHSGAVALLLCSECEGFGLPAVEAAACGTPVIATTASPLPELLSGGGLFVPPGDERAVTEAMGILLKNEPRRRAMGAHAKEGADRLSWTRSGRVALDALYEAAA